MELSSRMNPSHGNLGTLKSKDAALCSSADCSSESSCVREVMSSPSENSHDDSLDVILGLLDWREEIWFRGELGKASWDSIHHPAFLRSGLSAEALGFFMTDAAGDSHWHGFDTELRKWASLAILSFEALPIPALILFKVSLVAGHGREVLVLYNPLTQQKKVLPPLIHSRHPVLMHCRMDNRGHYKIVVAGSAAIGTEDRSLKTEEYDSRTGMWECPENSDIPCPPFGLNEYQNGVYFSDSERELLLFVCTIDASGRGVLVYDLKKKKWVQGPTRFHIPLVRSEPNVGYLATTQILECQIVECGGAVYVFSEQECGREVYFSIHKLNLDGSEDSHLMHNLGDPIWQRKRAGGRGLLVYPEVIIVPGSEHELRVFNTVEHELRVYNTVEHTIEIIDLEKPIEVAPLLPNACCRLLFILEFMPKGRVQRAGVRPGSVLLDSHLMHNLGDPIWQRKRAGGRGLLVYPEVIIVPGSEHELPVFNTVEHTIKIIDLEKPIEVAPLLPNACCQLLFILEFMPKGQTLQRNDWKSCGEAQGAWEPWISSGRSELISAS